MTTIIRLPSSKGVDIREKRANETIAIGFDFVGLCANNENISNVDIDCSNGISTNNENYVIGGNNNTQVTQLIEGGTAGNYYGVTFTATSSENNVFVRTFVLRIVDDALPLAADANRALVRLDEVKGYIGKATDEDTAVIDMLIDSVSAAFDRELGRHLANANYTSEAYDGHGGRYLHLGNYPVTGNIAVVEHGQTLALGANNDYVVENSSGVMRRVDSGWFCGPQEIVVTYTAGYVCTGANTNLPTDIRMAALRQIAFEFGRYQKKDWGIDAVTYPDGSMTRSESGLLKDVKQVLDGYRRWML